MEISNSRPYVLMYFLLKILECKNNNENVTVYETSLIRRACMKRLEANLHYSLHEQEFNIRFTCIHTLNSSLSVAIKLWMFYARDAINKKKLYIILNCIVYTYCM